MADMAALSAMSMVYSTSLLYAGFIGLGALWASSSVGGFRGGKGYGGGGGYGRGGGGVYRVPYRVYGGGGGGYRGRGGGYGGYHRSDLEILPPDLQYVETGHEKQESSAASETKPEGHIIPKETSHFAKKVIETGKKSAKTNSEKRVRRFASDDWKPLHVSQVAGALDSPRKLWVFRRFQRKTATDDPGLSIASIAREVIPIPRQKKQIRVNQRLPDEELLLRAIRDNDTDNCGLRLVCELSAVKSRDLTEEEKEILKFVRNGDELYNQVYPGEGVQPDSLALLDYKVAAKLGDGGENCTQVFSSCRASAAVMMQFITSLTKTTEAAPEQQS